MRDPVRYAQKHKKLKVGTISCDVSDNNSIIRELLEISKYVIMTSAHRNTLRMMKNVWADGQGEDVFETVHDTLSAYVPAMCYIGRNRDGEYGVWPDENEVPFHGRPTPEIGKGDELPNAFNSSHDYFLVVNDHGNCTLYRRTPCGRGFTWQEEWSLV